MGYYYSWLFCFVGATIYAFLWDIFMDWGLFPSYRTFLCIPCPPCNLRKRCMFRNRAVYFLATAADCFLRFFGTYTLLPQSSILFVIFIKADWVFHLSLISEMLEVLRRTLWSIFKMEWMQINYMVEPFNHQLESESEEK